MSNTNVTTQQASAQRDVATPQVPKTALLPPVDVTEDPAGITLIADLPGVAREDLHINVDSQTLTLEAPLRLGESAALESVYAEVRAAHFRRSFTLSRELDPSKIEAALKDGVLRLHVPKHEQAKPRRIEVRVA